MYCHKYSTSVQLKCWTTPDFPRVVGADVVLVGRRRKPADNQERYKVDMHNCRWTVVAGSRQKSGWTGKMSRQTDRSGIQSTGCGQIKGREYKGSYWAHRQAEPVYKIPNESTESRFKGVQTAK